MKCFTAGPTSISVKTRECLYQDYSNADLDQNYYKMHFESEDLFSKSVNNTDGFTFLILAEALFGLEMAVMNYAKDKRVLVIDNGIFGKSMEDFLKLAGARETVLFSTSLRREVDIEELEKFLEKDNDFFMATYIHCETPTAVTNNITEIGRILNKYNIMSMVDSVSSYLAHDIDVKRDNIDILIVGSQKALSLPSGLTIVSLSKKAKQYLEKNPPSNLYYGNFLNYFNQRDNNWFIYTMNTGLTRALHSKLSSIDVNKEIEKHRKYAKVIRRTLLNSKFKLFAESGFSNSVTAVEDSDTNLILYKLKERGFMLSTGLSEYNSKLFRIGHMGDNLDLDWKELFKNLDEVMKELGRSTTLEADFSNFMEEEFNG